MSAGAETASFESLPRRLWSSLRRAAGDFFDANGVDLAAMVAFYALFAIFPLLLSSVVILGYFVSSSPELPGRIVDALGVSAAPSLRQAVLETLVDMRSHQTARGVSFVVSIVMLLFAGGSLFVSIDDAIRALFRAPPRKRHGRFGALRTYLVSHLLGAGLVALTSVGVLASLVAGTILGHTGGGWLTVVVVQCLPIAGLLLTTVLALRIVPTLRVSWRAALFGGVVTTVLVTGARLLFAAFLRSALGYSAYGAFGALLGLATWIQLTCIATLFGVSCARAFDALDTPLFGEARRRARQDAPLRPNATPVEPRGEGASTAESPRWVDLKAKCRDIEGEATLACSLRNGPA